MEKTEVQLHDSDKICGESEILREAKKVLASAEKEVLVSLEHCIENLDCHTSTAEGIKEEFVTKTKTLHQVRTNQVKDRLQQATKRHVMHRDDIKSPQAYMLEKKVLDFLHHCRTTPKTFSNESLKQEFEKMWKNAASEFEINREEVVKKDVYQEVAAMLTENVISRYNTHCMTDGDTLQQCGRENFVLESVGLQKKAGDLVKHFDPHYQQKKLKSFCSNVINQCKFFITQTLEEEGDYSDTIIKDLLKIIDRFMTHRKVNEETEISLKKHICGIAAIEFQKMHNNFIEKCDTQAMLKVRKECYFDDFLERFHDKNQCQKKALQLINLCLKPAVLDYVTESTGSDVRQKLWEIIGSQDDNTAVALNCLILKELLDELNYDKYQKYIHHYNMFVKNWLLEQIDEQLFKDGQLSKIENQHLMEIINKIIAEVSKVQLSLGTDGEILSFVCCLYGALIQKLRLVFPQNALNSVMIEGITYKEEFADHLTTYLKEMKKMPINPYQTKADVRERLRYVLFKSKHSNPLLSCTEQCPFCKAPCEIARSIDHDQHFSSAHRPLGLCGLKASKTLVIETCSNPTWKGSKTSTLSLHSISHARMETQPWRTSHGSLQSASSQASNCTELTDYWRYVMVKLNERTANDFGMLPAELPHSWRSLSLTDALNSLNRWKK